MTKEEIQRGLMEAIECLAQDAVAPDARSPHVIVARRHIRFLCDLIDEAESRDAASPSKGTITVVLDGGRCVEIRNLPDGWLCNVREKNAEATDPVG